VTATRPDPVTIMLDIAGRFLAQAAELDQRVQAAVDANAAHGDIISLMRLAAEDRLRALAAAQAAAPFCSPKLQAIEVAPASPLTRDKFEARLVEMPEEEVLDHLKRIATGTLTLAAIEADEDEESNNER
jgi:hypothetical protein